jgi:hypothetical protein
MGWTRIPDHIERFSPLESLPMSEWSFTRAENSFTTVAQAFLLVTSKPSYDATQSLALAGGGQTSYPYVEIRGLVICDVLHDIDYD